MDNEEVIRDQMEDTRTSLADKLESLEKQVTETVTGATTNVTQTVEAVKETVQETVSSVRDTVQETLSAVKETMHDSVEAVKGFFDIPGHVERHPWFMFGGAVVAGYVAASMLGGRGTSTRRSAVFEQSEATHNGAGRRHGFSSGGLLSSFAPEIAKLKALAVGALMGAVRDTVKKSIPSHIGSSLDEIMAGITAKLTGDGSGHQEQASEFHHNRQPKDGE